LSGAPTSFAIKQVSAYKKTASQVRGLAIQHNAAAIMVKPLLFVNCVFANGAHNHFAWQQATPQAPFLPPFVRSYIAQFFYCFPFLVLLLLVG
jgi:hypothetical protein